MLARVKELKSEIACVEAELAELPLA